MTGPEPTSCGPVISKTVAAPSDVTNGANYQGPLFVYQSHFMLLPPFGSLASQIHPS